MAKAAATPETRTQKEMVTEILESGVLSPKEIVTVVKEKFGVDIAKGNVNQIKVQWKKQAGAAPARKARVKRVKRTTRIENSVPTAVEAQRTGNGRPTELEIAKFALRLGGVEQAIKALQDLIK